MSYQDTIDYLYSRLPMFSRIGAAAIKNDLHNTQLICSFLGNPENKFNFEDESESKSIKEAFEFALNIKKSTLAETSYKGLEGRILRFEKWLNENGFKNRLISSVNKKVITTNETVNNKA